MSGERLTVGVVSPHAAPGPEVELPAMTTGRLTTIVSRTRSPHSSLPAPSEDPAPHAELLASTEPAAIDRAASTFGASTLDAVVHASTTTGYVIGHREDAALAERLSQRFGVPAVTSCTAAAAALRAHGIGRLQLVHPPWFDPDFDDLGARYFRSRGLDTVVTRAIELPRDPADVRPLQVVDWVEHHVEERTEGIYLAGNGFRTAAAIAELERNTGRLVLGANQALLWGVLRATNTAWHLTGHGRVLHSVTSVT